MVCDVWHLLFFFLVKESLFGTYTFRHLNSMTIIVGSMKAGRHSNEAAAESLYTWVTSKRQSNTGNGVGFWKLKAHPKWLTSWNMVIPPHASSTVTATMDQYLNVWSYKSHGHSTHHVLKAKIVFLSYSGTWVYRDFLSETMVHKEGKCKKNKYSHFSHKTKDNTKPGTFE